MGRKKLVALSSKKWWLLLFFKWWKPLILAEIFLMTAKTLQYPLPKLAIFNYNKLLATYGQYTTAALNSLLTQQRDLGPLKKELFTKSENLTKKIKTLFRIKTAEEVCFFLENFYQVLGIELTVNLSQQQFVVKNCYFSRYYRSEICQVLSALDSGLVAGLTNGASLTFLSRLTEGATCCFADLRKFEGKERGIE